jgi:hypothetical protein
MSRHRGTAVPSFKRKALSAAPAGTPVELPEPLRAWRLRTLGACLEIRGEQITLHELGGVRRAFNTAAEAIAEVSR